MKRAVSVSLGSSARDKRVVITLGEQEISIERIGTDGDVDKREYPLHAALKLVQGVRQTPVVDGRGLKHTLERRVFELAEPILGPRPHFARAFVPVAVDRQGLAVAVAEVSDELIIGDLMVALEIPIPVSGMRNFRRVARILLPFVSHFPMSMLFYGSSGAEQEPKYLRFWDQSDLLAGDFLFMRKYVPDDLSGKTVITNTTTPENVEFMRERGVRQMITTTPRYEGRSFGTNMMEAALTAYAGRGRPLSDEELNTLIDQLDLRPSVQQLNE